MHFLLHLTVSVTVLTMGNVFLYVFSVLKHGFPVKPVEFTIVCRLNTNKSPELQPFYYSNNLPIYIYRKVVVF